MRVQVLVAIMAAWVAAAGCTEGASSQMLSESENGETPKTRVPTPALVELLFQNYFPATYSFEPRLMKLRDEGHRFEGPDLYCYHMDDVPGGYGPTQTLSAFESGSGIWDILCWDNKEGMLAALEQDVTWTVRTGSKLSCTPAAHKERTTCRRIEEYDRYGNRYELYKGIELIVDQPDGDPFIG